MRLAFESREPLWIGREYLWQDFDRDVALQPRIAGAIHLAHAAGSERAGDFVWTEAGSSTKGIDCEGGGPPVELVYGTWSASSGVIIELKRGGAAVSATETVQSSGGTVLS